MAGSTSQVLLTDEGLLWQTALNTSSGLFEKSLKENWQYDSFWKLWVGIVKFKFFCSVFHDHNWISNVNGWFMFRSVLFFALCRAHGYVLIETLCTCLHMSCFSNLVLQWRNVGTGEKAQNTNSFLSKQLLLLFIPWFQNNFLIISSWGCHINRKWVTLMTAYKNNQNLFWCYCCLSIYFSIIASLSVRVTDSGAYSIDLFSSIHASIFFPHLSCT